MKLLYINKLLAEKRQALREAEKAYQKSNGKHRSETRHAYMAVKREYEQLLQAA